MQESTDRKKPAEENDSEATSHETLSDVEENQADVASETSNPDPGPSPDGALDESDEIKDAGPM